MCKRGFSKRPSIFCSVFLIAAPKLFSADWFLLSMFLTNIFSKAIQNLGNLIYTYKKEKNRKA